MSDPYLTAYGVVVAALRDDSPGIQTLFQNLTPEETAAVAEGALLTMAGTLRDLLDPHSIQTMISAVQHLAATDATEGKTR